MWSYSYIMEKILLNIANNSDYVYNICIEPLSDFDWHCREGYFQNLKKNNNEVDYNNNPDNNFNLGDVLFEFM